MLQSISWSQYCLVVGVTTIAYYLFVWAVFFKARLSFLQAIRPFHPAYSGGEDAPDEIMTTTQHVIDEIRNVFEGRQSRSELLLALQHQLTKYKDFEDIEFRTALNQFITAESERQCSIRLNEDDLRAVWL